VKTALIQDGWTITHDPFALPFGLHNLYVDWGAEQMLAAEKDGQQIVVEVQSFLGRSEVEGLEHAWGQYLLYRCLLQRRCPERTLHLAVPEDAFNGVFSTQLGYAVREEYALKLIVFDPFREVILQ